MSVMMTSTCMPFSKARYSAAVRAIRGVLIRSTAGSLAKLLNSTVRSMAPVRRNSLTKNSGGNWTEQIAPVGGRNSLLVPAWYRGVSLIMQTMGQMLVQYQRRSKEGGNYREDLFGPSGDSPRCR